jgi:hypothetical protein
MERSHSRAPDAHQREKEMAAKQVNLAKLFQGVATALTANRDVLNQADTYNHDHGDNMVEIFEVVAQAIKARKTASPADQLAYAGELLRQKQSGSAKYYAGGLMSAAQKFAGKSVTPDNAMDLIKTLIGGAGAQGSAGTPAAPPDMLGSLLSGLGASGAQGSAGTSVPQPDMLGSLLSSLGGGGAQGSAGAQSGLDIGSLLSAGMSYMNAKQRGETDGAALMGALASATSGGNTPYRAQSGAVVANALMQALGAMASKKR